MTIPPPGDETDGRVFFAGAVPAAEAERFREGAERLLERVNEWMRARADLGALTGGAPWPLVADNHRHHGLFLADILRFNRYGLLEAVLPWVYRVYRVRGFSFDYFLAHLAAWRQAVAEELPGAEAILRLYDAMIARHERTITESAGSSPFDCPDLRGEDRENAQRIATMLLAGARDEAQDEIARILAGGATFERLCDRVLRPAMVKIGLGWEVCVVNEAHEHLATSLLAATLAVASAARPRVRGHGRLALVSAAPNEFHEVGAWMVADALATAGYGVRHLGANTPAASLAAMAAELRPALVAVSVGTVFNLGRAADAVAAVRRAAPGCRVIAGGIPFEFDAGLAEALGADAGASTVAEAVPLADRLTA